jgi:hypothetical protein
MRNDNDIQEASLLHFQKFQGKIYNIVETLSVNWKQAKSGNQKVTMDSTFHQVSKLLHLKDLPDY